MAIVIPELILLKVINIINKHYWDDWNTHVLATTQNESLLYNMFGGLEIDEFNYLDNIVKIFDNHFKEHQKPMTINLGWSPERMKYPSVCLLLPNEEVTADGINVVVGQEITNTAGDKWRDVKSYSYQVTYAILISSDNANETMLLYHYFKTILIAGIEQLELNDFGDFKVSGKDHTMQMDVLPQQAHHRTVDLTFLYDNTIWGILENDVTTGITINGNSSNLPAACLAASLFINAFPVASIPSGQQLYFLVKDTNGDAVGALIGGEWIVPAAGGGGGSSIAIVQNSNLTFDVTFDTVDNPLLLPDVTVDIEVFNSITSLYDVVDTVTFAGSDPNPEIIIDT